jgi:hypothetical protein
MLLMAQESELLHVEKPLTCCLVVASCCVCCGCSAAGRKSRSNCTSLRIKSDLAGMLGTLGKSPGGKWPTGAAAAAEQLQGLALHLAGDPTYGVRKCI